MNASARCVLLLLFALAFGACRKDVPHAGPQTGTSAKATPVVISIIGTNDLHGRIRALPFLSGYLANLRSVRAADGGVVLVDGGDMFQGTLESNLSEGASVVKAYNAMGYTAVAVGNHEFDYGPVGPAVVPPGAMGAAVANLDSAAKEDAITDLAPEVDPVGALRARAKEARYPFLVANVLLKFTGRLFAHDNIKATHMTEVRGIKVGMVGLTTEATLTTTIAPNVAHLKMRSLAKTLTEQAQALRAQGAVVIVAVAHAGGNCEEVEKPRDLATCDADQEIFKLARALPSGLVDVIVGGHTHAAVAHYVNGIAIIESLAYGRAFGRVDVIVENGKVTDTKIHQPKNVCAFWDNNLPEFQRWDSCKPSSYEGADVRIDTSLLALIEPDLATAKKRHEEPLGAVLTEPFTRNYDIESAVGNLFTSLMLKARKADLAMANGGGLRSDLPAGALTYGALYQSFPFDNAFAKVHLTGAQLRTIVRRNLKRRGGILSLAGVRVKAKCKGEKIVVEITRDNGKLVKDTDKLTMLTSDFLATGGDGSLLDIGLAADAIELEPGAIIRESLAEGMKTVGTISPSTYLVKDAPRMAYPEPRPVVCP